MSTAIGVAVALIVSGCTQEAAPPESVGVSGYVVAEVAVEPAVAVPGSTVTVRVRLPQVTGLAVVGGWWGDTLGPLDFEPDGDVLVAEFSLEVGDELRDRIFTVDGEFEGGTVIGYGSVSVSPSTCAGGLTRVAGECVPVERGHSLEIDRILPWWYIAPSPDGQIRSTRDMNHPRSIARNGRALFVCSSDAVNMADIEEIKPPEDLDIGPTYNPPVAEAWMEQTGLAVCQDVDADFKAGVGFAASRGDGAGIGGLSVWRIPTRTQPPFDAPELIQAVEHKAGIEELVASEQFVFATGGPDRLLVYQRLDDETLDKVVEYPIPGAVAVWGIALDGDRLYVTDVGSEHLHQDGTAHLHDGGQLFVLDVSEPFNPIVIGSAETQGPAKGMAVLPEKVLAVSSGTAGVELFDVADSTRPKLLSAASTHGSVVSVAHDKGYLVASTWEGVRLWNVVDRGVLRLLDTTDGLERPMPKLPGILNRIHLQSFLTTYFVHVQDNEVLVAEFSNVYRGTIYPNRSAPRLNVHARKVVVPDGVSRALVRVSSGGSEPVFVSIPERTPVVEGDPGVLLAPGEMGWLEFDVDAEGLDTFLAIQSTDPSSQTRDLMVVPRPDQYAPGDPIPQFQLPAISPCSGDGVCRAPSECIDIKEEVKKGRPVVLAFFSSW